MNIFNRYIEKQYKYSSINIEIPEINASIFIVIPCYNEPDIIKTINSLAECYPPKSKAAVLIVVNSSEDSPPQVLSQNLITLSSIEQWKVENPDSFLNIYTIHVSDLPRKFAGVGLARKIGMDEVIHQLETNGQGDGIIVSLDADCTVLKNYLIEIERSFEENDKNNFFTIDFSHPVDIEGLSDFEQEGIIRYELHMRYYRNAMKWCGYPHSIYTVGSSFAVRASAYVKQGGMNRRKAGEDFYFLHKLVLLGPYGNISSTTVYPAARTSDRVPFGTGAAMKKWAEVNSELMTTYSFDAFLSLKPFFNYPEQFLELNEEGMWKIFMDYPAELKTFIKQSGTDKAILELQSNCSNAIIFVKRFFHLVNAFWILKYLNFVHKQYFRRGDLYEETIRLLLLMGTEVTKYTPPLQILEIFRSLDKRKDS
jgi:glycosyltransferase involved in cell wall biosynthesis